MRMSDWSSDVCSSDLLGEAVAASSTLASRRIAPCATRTQTGAWTWLGRTLARSSEWRAISCVGVIVSGVVIEAPGAVGWGGGLGGGWESRPRRGVESQAAGGALVSLGGVGGVGRAAGRGR